MTITPAVLQGGIVLTTSPTVLYTCPAATKVVVKRAVFTNVSAAAATLTVTSTRSGGSALTIVAAMSLAAGQAYTTPELSNYTLQAGDAVSASAGTAASINAFASGFTVI